MSNYNIEEMARGMGFNDSYLNKLRSTNQFINESANQDRNQINAQLKQTISDYEKERQDQNNNFIKEAQSAYVDYAKAINPYSAQRSQANRVGLGNSGYSESSLIGANNTYQNRYTNTKTNYDNIFANINNNIAKARETSNIELAKIAKNEQDRMLENLYRLNDLYTAEKQREEELALQRAAAARSSSRSSSRRSSSSSGTVSVSAGNDGQETISDYAKSLANSLKKVSGTKTFGIGNALIKQSQAKIEEQVNQGKLTPAEAGYIFKELGI